MTNITALRREAIADRVTGWTGDPITERAPSADQLMADMRRATWTPEQVRDVVQLLAGKMSQESIIGILDTCADDLSDEIYVPRNPVLDGTAEELNAIVLEQWI